MQPKKGDHVGLKLKSYTFTRMIGAGAWGTVYEVYDDKTRNIAACKKNNYSRQGHTEETDGGDTEVEGTGQDRNHCATALSQR